MALPAALVPLGRAAVTAVSEAAPAIKAKALAYYKRATDGRVQTEDAATAYAQSSKSGLATVAAGLVSSGLNPNQIFTNKIMQELRDSDMRQLAENLRAEFGRVYGSIDAASSFRDVQHDPRESATRLLAAETVSYVRRRLLNSSNDDKLVRELHVKLRLFTGMSEDLLGEALAMKASNA